MKGHFVCAIWTPNKFSVSNFDNALLLLRVMKRSAYLDKFPIVIFMDAFYGV